MSHTPDAEYERLLQLLKGGQLDAFLQAFERFLESRPFEPKMAQLTQQLLPTELRQAFAKNAVTPNAIVRLWSMVGSGRLLLVDNELRSDINNRLRDAWQASGHSAAVPEPLKLFEQPCNSTSQASERAPLSKREDIVEMQRVAVVNSFALRTWSASDALDFRKNLCASGQEREFLKAVRQFFPNLLAYPNVPLCNFIELEKLEATLSIRARTYAKLSQVDVLLCTLDEDPIAGIELDSALHDTESASERDELKNRLFTLAGMHLVRIRSSNARTVRAEDFFTLLKTQEHELKEIRPQRLRPRRTHDALAPHGSAAVTLYDSRANRK